MNSDMTVSCGDGLINIRVGAVIRRNGNILMVNNGRTDYYYSVGGRIKFGETAEEAVIREVLEETGVKLEIERLAFVHENYFIGDAPTNFNKLIYEISFFFLMKVPVDFEPVCHSFTEDNCPEHLYWISPDTDKIIYPEFFRTALSDLSDGVKYYLTDERES